LLALKYVAIGRVLGEDPARMSTRQKKAVALAVAFACARIASADNTVIDFEAFPGMSFFGGTPVAAESQLSNQLQDSYGVLFSSVQPWVAVVNLGPGHATSGNNGIGPVNADNLLDYSAPIQISFTYPLHPEIPATTDFVSIRADLLGGGTPNTVSGFDATSNLLAEDTEPDTGGTTFSVAEPNIHRVLLQGNGTTAFDDLVFGTLVATKEIINFEGLQGTDFVEGTAIQPETRLTDQFVNRGVLFSSSGGYAAVVNLGAGHAYSGTNGIGGSTTAGTVTYESIDPVIVTFVSPTNRDVLAVTSYVSVRVDRLHTLGVGQYSIEAYGVDGRLLGSATADDAEGAFPEISAIGIHALKLIGSGTTAFDDLVFDPLQNAQPRLLISQSDQNVTVSWPAVFANFQLETASNLSAPQWQAVTQGIVTQPNGYFGFAVNPNAPQQFFRLRLP
jgi:hypothetical protein